MFNLLLFFLSSQKSVNTTNSTIQQTNSGLLPIHNDQKDLKTHTGKYFSLRYPSNVWELTAVPKTKIVGVLETFTLASRDKPFNTQQYINVTVYQPGFNQLTSPDYNDEKNEIHNLVADSGLETAYFKGLGDIVVDQQKGLWFDNISFDNSYFLRTTWVSANNVVYLIQWNISTSPTRTVGQMNQIKQEYSKQYQQILASIKLTSSQ